LKILHIDTGAQMRGGQYQVRLLLSLLRQSGIEVELLAHRHSPLALWAHGNDVPVNSATLRNVFRYSRRFDLTHAHDAHAHALAALASGKPIVVSRRVAFPVRSSFLSRWKYNRASRFLAVSEFSAGQLRVAGVPDEKIDVVYDAFEAAEEGVWNLKAPAVALESKDPAKGRDLIERAARIAGIDVTYSSDLPCDLRCASMFLYITRSEGLGLAVIIAMRMGIPVIASRVGGLAEVFEHEHSGLYTENQPAVIASVICKILDNPERTRDMVANAKARAREKFSPATLVERTIAAYRRALGE
jgi:glycosyltransferase involved in cell wall biosynthesis